MLDNLLLAGTNRGLFANLTLLIFWRFNMFDKIFDGIFGKTKTLEATSRQLNQERIKYYSGEKNLYDYQLRFINSLLEKLDLRGKAVLEVGGSNLPNELVFGDIGAKKWVCVDKFWDVHTKTWSEHYSSNPIYRFGDVPLQEAMTKHDYVIYNEIAENIGEEFLNSFDVCISLCSFEHIQNIVSVLNKIHMSLVQGGKFYTQFGPIWSSCGGSHFWVDDNLNFNKRYPLPDYAHLLLSYPEILNIFLTMYDVEAAQHHAYNVYSGHRCDVNGFFYEDYEKLMEVSNFIDYKVFPSVTVDVNYATMEKLQSKYHPYKRFDVWEIGILATK